MRRGTRGVLPRAASLSDESYLDFVQSFRRKAVAEMYPLLEQVGNPWVEAQLPAPAASASMHALRETLNGLPVVRTWQRFMRSHQEMMWRRTRDSIVAEAPRWLDAMLRAETQSPGSLRFDPNFEVPEYARAEVHLQPGGYADDPLGGPVFHYGTHTFYQGDNEQDQLHREMAALVTPPADGHVSRVLDLACSIGQATFALKERFPQAEVWGLDVSSPLLRYAHWLGVERRADVHFVQGLAEAQPFPDAHFDVVMAYILFHEIPWRIAERVVPEVARVLRPGGTFCIYEFPNAGNGLTHVSRFLIDYDSRDNCEPYSPQFVYADFRGLLEDCSFDVREGPRLSNGFLQSLVAVKR